MATSQSTCRNVAGFLEVALVVDSTITSDLAIVIELGKVLMVYHERFR